MRRRTSALVRAAGHTCADTRASILVFGSSVAGGDGGKEGWVQRFANATRSFEAIENHAVAGTASVNWVRFLRPGGPARAVLEGSLRERRSMLVILSLSLANEGLPMLALPAQSAAADLLRSAFVLNMMDILEYLVQIVTPQGEDTARNHTTLAICGPYPHSMYTPAHYSVLQAASDELRTMVEKRREHLEDSVHVLFVTLPTSATGKAA